MGSDRRLFAGLWFAPYHPLVRRYAFPFALLVMALLGAHAIHLPSAVGWHDDAPTSIHHSPTTGRAAVTHQAVRSLDTASWGSVSHAVWCAIQAVSPQTQVAFVLILLGFLLPLPALAPARSGPVAFSPAWRAPPRQRRALLQAFLL
jgi:hypothetical protein